MDISNKKVNFLGDSITEGSGASLPDKCYVSLFKKAYPNADIGNYGISGTRIARQVVPYSPRMDLDFNMRAVEMDDGADLVVVFGGVNDFGHGDAPFGEFGDTTVNTFCGAVYALYETLLNKYPLAKILVLTPLHFLREDVPDKKGKILSDYVQIIRKTAEYFSLPVLDLWASSGMNPRVAKVQETMMTDGLHPNDNGHQRLFELIDAYIKAML